MKPHKHAELIKAWENLKPYPTPTQYANALTRIAELEKLCDKLGSYKNLTDDEIMQQARYCFGDSIDNIDDMWVLMFARKIIEEVLK